MKASKASQKKKKETGFSHVDLDWLLLRIYYRLVKVLMVVKFKSLQGRNQDLNLVKQKDEILARHKNHWL